MNYGRDDSVLEDFVEELRTQLGRRFKQFILFGSRARGDDVPGSDYDCLIVVDEVSPETKDIIDEVAGEFLFQHGVVFSAFPVSEERYRQQTFDPFLMNVRKEGIVL